MFSVWNSSLGKRGGDAESRVSQIRLSRRSQGKVKPPPLRFADPALLVVIGSLSYLGWGQSAAGRKGSLYSFFSTFVSKVTLLRKFLVAVEKFPVASDCQTL